MAAVDTDHRDRWDWEMDSYTDVTLAALYMVQIHVFVQEEGTTRHLHSYDIASSHTECVALFLAVDDMQSDGCASHPVALKLVYCASLVELAQYFWSQLISHLPAGLPVVASILDPVPFHRNSLYTLSMSLSL